MSLAQLSDWCRERFGEQTVRRNQQTRRFDIPWMVMDAAQAKSIWGWERQTTLQTILEEIALHAQEHPEWLELSGTV